MFDADRISWVKSLVATRHARPIRHIVKHGTPTENDLASFGSSQCLVHWKSVHDLANVVARARWASLGFPKFIGGHGRYLNPNKVQYPDRVILPSLDERHQQSFLTAATRLLHTDTTVPLGRHASGE